MKNKTILAIIIVLAAVAIIVFAASGSKNNESQQTPTDLLTNETTELANPGTYTLAEVSAHNSAESCWAAVNGSVYDLTSWIAQHPGGQEAILGLCGKDGSAAFNGQHGGQENPAKALANFKIGTLK